MYRVQCHLSCRFPLDGTVAQNGRRDMRRGKARGCVELTSRGIVMLCRWDDPLAGWSVEHLELRDGELHVHSQLHMNGRHVAFTSIYVQQ
jgi:hypothetical protein